MFNPTLSIHYLNFASLCFVSTITNSESDSESDDSVSDSESESESESDSSELADSSSESCGDVEAALVGLVSSSVASSSLGFSSSAATASSTLGSPEDYSVKNWSESDKYFEKPLKDYFVFWNKTILVSY